MISLLEYKHLQNDIKNNLIMVTVVNVYTTSYNNTHLMNWYIR